MFGKSKNSSLRDSILDRAEPPATTPSFLANMVPAPAPAPAPAPVFAPAPAQAPAAAADEAQRNGAAGGPGNFLLDRNKPSVISEGFLLMGDVSASGVLHVEGTVKGTIKTDVVNIGPRGAVEGTVQCNSLQIKGTFVGTASCDDLLIAGKAQVTGRLTYLSVSVQRGAVIDGDLIQATQE